MFCYFSSDLSIKLINTVKNGYKINSKLFKQATIFIYSFENVVILIVYINEIIHNPIIQCLIANVNNSYQCFTHYTSR